MDTIKMSPSVRTYKRPYVGQQVLDSRFGTCVVVAVYAAGTMDVRADNGKHYRITGLSFR